MKTYTGVVTIFRFQTVTVEVDDDTSYEKIRDLMCESADPNAGDVECDADSIEEVGG